MSFPSQGEGINERQDRLLTMLEHLLELPVSAVHFMLDQAVQQVREVLAADLVAFFFHDPTNETLMALNISDTPMGRQQRAIGMDRLPLANGGSVVEVFLSGVSAFTTHADRDPNELLGIKVGLDVKSQMASVFKVQTHHRGVVLAASATPDFFLPGDLWFLEAIARWVGLVVGRGELVERMKEKHVEQERVAEELLTIMTHELRNYLQPLGGRLDLMMERARREGREKDVRDAESSIHTLNLLARGISDVVDIARLNQGVFALTPVSMNMKEIVQEVVMAFAVEHVPLSVRSPREVILTADPQRVRQALETMLLYVVSSSSKPAEISVEVSIERRRDGPWVLLSVKTVGSALPHVSGSLLHPFFVSSHSTQLGVQLYLTKQIALAHHGTLTIDAPNHDETRLTLTFPVEEEELVVRGEDEIQ